MKIKSILPGISLLIAFALLVGCGTSSNSATTGQETAATTGSSDEDTPMIAVGMTKNQVLKAWGEPSGKQITGRGEIWVWGGQRWKRMIPYAGPFLKIQTSKALFGTDGRVKDFRLSDQGDVMSEAEGYSSGYSQW